MVKTVHSVYNKQNSRTRLSFMAKGKLCTLFLRPHQAGLYLRFQGHGAIRSISVPLWVGSYPIAGFFSSWNITSLWNSERVLINLFFIMEGMGVRYLNCRMVSR